MTTLTTPKRPRTILAVEEHLRALLPPAVEESLTSPYPFLYGMATMELAEANREIERLLALTRELNTDRSCDNCGNDWRGSRECPFCACGNEPSDGEAWSGGIAENH